MTIPTDQRPVVVAVDDSDSARDAAMWAAGLAADWSAPLHVLHVPDGDPHGLPKQVDDWLTELVAAAERCGAHPVAGEARPGEVLATVAERSVGARMVVLGNYGRDTVAGMLAGATATAITARVGCPVAVVRGSAPRFAPPRTGPVVVGVDGLVGAAAALTVAADLAGSVGTELVVLHTAAGGVDDFPEARRRLARLLAPRLSRHPGLVVEIQMVDGSPLRALTSVATAARALVVGTRARGQDPGLELGPVGVALLRFAPCPIVIVHPHGPPGGPLAHSTRP